VTPSCLVAASLLLLAGTAAAQDARGIAHTDGTHAIRFPSRPGVCGDGTTIVRRRAAGTGNVWMMRFNNDASGGNARSMDDLDSWCVPGPVLVTLERRAGQIVDMDFTVGGAIPPGTMDVSADEAIALLIGEIARGTSGGEARTAITAATLAAGESWPALLQLARDASLPSSTRRAAHGALASQASERLLAQAGSLDDEEEVRRHAVFALSRRRDDTSRAALWDLTRPGTEPVIRSAAVFWAGQERDDPRVLDLFEAVLRGR
jgi:hypothetical protein